MDVKKSIHARIAAKKRWHPDDPSIAEDERELRVLLLEDHVREVVGGTPCLRPEDVARIRRLFPGEGRTS